MDASGNPINGFSFNPTGSNESIHVSLSSDASTLTAIYDNPVGTSSSIFFENNFTGLLPSGTVSYDWSITFPIAGTWQLETDGQTVLSRGSYSGGTHTGHVSLDYATPDYFSYGNVGFGGELAVGGTGVRLVLSNFDFSPVPEPGSLALLGGGLAVLGLYVGRRKLGALRTAGRSAIA